MITCSLTDIPAQISVTWDPYTSTVADFKKDDGTHSGTSQTATLTISAAKLLALHGAGSASVDFKCKIQVGTAPTDVTATQTVSIYSPSENIIFPIILFMTIITATQVKNSIEMKDLRLAFSSCSRFFPRFFPDQTQGFIPMCDT